MVRKVVCTVFAAAMLLGLSSPAHAAEDVGSIRVSLNLGELPAINGIVTLYQVGTPMADGYRMADIFGGGIVKDADAQSPYLAKWLAEAAGDSGLRQPLDPDGNAEFSNLQEGLYLVTQTERTDGFYSFEPFLLKLPNETRWHLQVNVEPEPIVADTLANPQTGQPAAPLLGAMGMAASAAGLSVCMDKKRRK